MKLLFLAPYPPYPPRGGGQQRMYQFLRHTAQAHDVWLLTFRPKTQAETELDPLRQLCHVTTIEQPRHTPGKRLRTLIGSTLPDMALRGRSAALRTALSQLHNTVQFDVVQAESIEMAQYGMAHQDSHQTLYVYDAFNAEYVIQQRAFTTDLRSPRRWPTAAYSLIQWHKLRHYETCLPRRFNAALAVSEEDATTIRQLTPTLPLGVVPNGVDTTFFRPDHQIQQDEPPLLLFTGTLDYRPNIDAITWFVDRVFPLILAKRPEARFVIVGRNPTSAIITLADHPKIDVIGEVEDVRPWFNRAHAYVVPMRIGGGVRLKLLEALAMERPVIATTMGAEGVEGLVNGTHALLADDPVAFAASVGRVLDDHHLGRTISVQGRQLVVARYDWQTIVPRMIDLWEHWRASLI